MVALAKAPEGTFVDVNSAWEDFFGFSKKEAIGKNSLELGINPDAEMRKRVAGELQKTGGVKDLEINLKDRSGQWHKCLLNISVLTMDGEKYFLNVLEDITKGNPFSTKTELVDPLVTPGL